MEGKHTPGPWHVGGTMSVFDADAEVRDTVNIYLRSVRSDLTSPYDGTTRWPRRGWMRPCPDWDASPTITCGHGYHLCGEADDPVLVRGPVWQAVRAEGAVPSPETGKHRAERVYVLKTGAPDVVLAYLAAKHGWVNDRLTVAEDGGTYVVESGQVLVVPDAVDATVTVKSGGECYNRGSGSVTVEGGGWCSNYGSGSVTVKSGWCYNHGSGSVTVEGGCHNYGSGSVTVEGGGCYNHGSGSVTVQGGWCHNYGSGSVTVKSGWCYNHGSGPVTVKSGGWCYNHGSGSVTVQGGWCYNHGSGSVTYPGVTP
jgi:hypothetical protein